MSTESDYGKIAPKIREEDRAYLGLTDAAFEKIATTLTEKIRGYARAGFRNPADVSRLLNKEEIRTAAGTEGNPRLVYFVLGRIFGDGPRKTKAPQPTTSFDFATGIAVCYHWASSSRGNLSGQASSRPFHSHLPSGGAL